MKRSRLIVAGAAVASLIPLLATGDSQVWSSLAISEPFAVPAWFIATALVLVGAVVVAWLVDVCVHAIHRPAFAGVPLASGYVFSSAIGASDLSWWWFLPPSVAFLALLVGNTLHEKDVEPRQRLPLLREGRTVGLLALSVAIAIPALPFIAHGIVNGNDGDGRTIRTDNPILNLKRDLTQITNIEILRYTSTGDAPRYIRSVTLDVFDGKIWKTSDRSVPHSVADGLPWPQGLRNGTIPAAEYRIDVTDRYQSTWLPLPYPAQEIDIEGDWRYHAETLDVVSADADVQGTSYRVRSLDIAPTAEQLRSAGTPQEDVRGATDLPDDVPDLVMKLARDVTADATNDYDRAVALQDWFRGPNGGFTYDLTTAPGTSNSALTDFLTERRGYCEQFAGTMAVMARSLGIPARVAVGFTPGEEAEDGSRVVRANDAHAWPELYFEGAGWVPFEPTPATRTGPPPEWTASSPETSSEPPTHSEPTTAPSAAVEAQSENPSPTAQAWLIAVLVVVVMLMLSVAPALIGWSIKHWRRRRSGDDPLARAEVAWAELHDMSIDAGVAWDFSATPRKVRHLLAERLDAGGHNILTGVIDTIERARYAPTVPETTSLFSEVSDVRRQLMGGLSQPLRVKARLWPACLLHSPRSRRSRQRFSIRSTKELLLRSFR